MRRACPQPAISFTFPTVGGMIRRAEARIPVHRMPGREQRLRPRTSNRFWRMTLLGCLGGTLLAHPVLATDRIGEAQAVFRELAVSLCASSYFPVSFQGIAESGLQHLQARHPCFVTHATAAEIELRCAERVDTAVWPPTSGNEVAAVLTRALRVVDPEMALAADVQAIARGLAQAAADPYTAYYPPRDVRKLDRAAVAGVGVQMTPHDPTLVRDVRPGSSAERADIRPGDRIFEIDGASTLPMSFAELSAALLGQVGAPVRLQVIAARTHGPRLVELTRAPSSEAAVTITALSSHRIYVRIPSFAPGVAAAVAQGLGGPDVRGVILDLRQNPGGLIREAQGVLELFFDEGDLGHVRPKAGQPVERYRARAGSLEVRAPVVVLIDGGSASASEWVAMVLQERQRATVLGTRSYGKGTVQQLIRLPNDGVLRVTNAIYTGPSGEPLPRAGLRPDAFLRSTREGSVLTGGSVWADGWVLAALDVLEGQEGGAPRTARARFGPMP